jgi:predicted dehydrogenase
MIRIAIVGIGFMGMIHFLASRKLKGARVAAICSRDAKKRAGDWRGIRGNFGPAGTMMDLAGVKTYRSLDELLDDPEIDLVDVCSPTNLHARTAIAALKAGKHVLVEKPIALLPKDADAMVKAAREAGKLLMVAHVLPFHGEFAFAAEAIRSGPYGKLLAAHFERVISRPDWSSEIADPAKTGGPAVDLHIHDTHFIGLACGVPGQVFSSGTLENGNVQYLTTQYLYGPAGPSVSCSSGAVAMKGRMFVHGFEIYLEKATLVYSSANQPLTVFTADGKSTTPKFKGGGDATSAFTAEIQQAVDGVRAGKEPELLSGKLARDALVMCYQECRSVKSGKPIKIE